MSHPFQEAFPDPILCPYMFFIISLTVSLFTVTLLRTETVLFIFILATSVAPTAFE